MKALFVHDHVFLKYKDKYYSNGKLTYSVLSYYLNFCDSLLVVGRFKVVDYDPGLSFLSEGTNVKVIGFISPLTLNGFLNYKETEICLSNLIINTDFVIIRQPSELGLMASKLTKSLNKPSIVEMVASPFDCLWYRGDLFAKLYAPILHFRMKSSIKCSKYVVYVTNNYLQSYYPTLGDNINISDARVKDNSSLKKIDEDKKFIIGVIANPGLPLKGIHSLFKALLRLDENKYELQIVGGALSSPLEVAMQKQPNIKQLGFIANREDLYNWLSEIDLYIQPSFTEGLPRSIIEAMSFGIPVIGSRVGGIPEVVHNDYLFKAGSVSEIVSVINRVSCDSDIYENLSIHSAIVSREFGSDLDLKKIEFFNKFKSENFKGL